VTGLLVAGPYGYGLVEAGCVVDSTGCSDVPAMAGAPTVVMGAEHVAVQGTGLAGLMPGREYQNSDHNFSDDTDIVDATAMLVSAKLKFRDEFDCGELIDSRERRQIVGDSVIRSIDILCGHRYPDTVCVATSNFDSHGFTIDPVFMIKPADKRLQLWADIPLRCLLPQGLDGVLATGLGISAHRDALPVIRMQADVQNQGYAAGFIAARSAKSQLPVRALDIRDIQKHLVATGNLPERVFEDRDNFPVTQDQIEEAVREGWDDLAGIALILHEGACSLPVLRRAYWGLCGVRSMQSLRYAQMLAFMGSDDGMTELCEALSARVWDQGWRFRGMHQFGMTVSEVDILMICLGLVGSDVACPVILEKTRTLSADAELSHFRAIAICCENFYVRHPRPELAPELACLLQRPGYRGHAQNDINHVQRDLTVDINENTVRDRALRELHLARALYRCGDSSGLGRQVLEAYSRDRRGHFARHARSILQEQQ
jgi:hypothetical protein